MEAGITVKRIVALLATCAIVLGMAPAAFAAAPDRKPPVSIGSTILHDDHFTICKSDLSHWTRLDVLRNDSGFELNLFETGQPAHTYGEARARWSEKEQRVILSYRNTGDAPNSTYWIWYSVYDGHGHASGAFWRINVDLDC